MTAKNGTPDVDALTSDDFERILHVVLGAISETHRMLLRIHHDAPDHAISTAEISAAMGWRGDSANLHYGKFAGLLNSFVSRPENSDKLYAIAWFDTADARWVLRQEFIEASQRVGLL